MEEAAALKSILGDDGYDDFMEMRKEQLHVLKDEPVSNQSNVVAAAPADSSGADPAAVPAFIGADGVAISVSDVLQQLQEHLQSVGTNSQSVHVIQLAHSQLAAAGVIQTTPPPPPIEAPVFHGIPEYPIDSILDAAFAHSPSLVCSYLSMHGLENLYEKVLDVFPYIFIGLVSGIPRISSISKTGSFNISHACEEFSSQASSSDSDNAPLLVFGDLNVSFAHIEELQSSLESSGTTEASRFLAIKEAIEWSYFHGFFKYAPDFDSFLPLSMSGKADLTKLGETLVDSLDTLLLANFSTSESFELLVNTIHVGGQNEINLFETTIRVVGGLLSYFHFANEPRSLQLAVKIMDAMIDSGCFNSSSGLPYGTVTLYDQDAGSEGRKVVEDSKLGALSFEETKQFGVQGKRGHATNPLWVGGASSFSEVATLQLELYSLAAFTGRNDFAKLATSTMWHLYSVDPPEGLWPIYIDPVTGIMKDSVITLGARGDSSYEYFLKQWLLLNGPDWQYETERAYVVAYLALEILLAGTSHPLLQPTSNASDQVPVGASLTSNSRNMKLTNSSKNLIHSHSLGVGGLNPRYLLTMYNHAVTGIIDRLVQKSTPSSYLYVAEQDHSILATTFNSSVIPTLIPKMDHLVCFLPGLLGLGAKFDAGHEVFALRKEEEIRRKAIEEVIRQFVMWIYLRKPNEMTYVDKNTTIVFSKDILTRFSEVLHGSDSLMRLYTFTLRAEHVSSQIFEQMDTKKSGKFDSLSLELLFPDEDVMDAGNLKTWSPWKYTEERDEKINYPPYGFRPRPHIGPRGYLYSNSSEDVFGSFTEPGVIRRTLMKTASGLLDTCIAMYDKSPSGLAPEIIRFEEGNDFIIDPNSKFSLLRPETVESIFIMYRITRKQEYLDAGWRIFEAIQRHARVNTGGYANVRAVDNIPNASSFDDCPSEEACELLHYSHGRENMNDKMESFFVAETLKYLYLLFSKPGFSLRNYVFNTEAHLLPILTNDQVNKMFKYLT
jgi:Glycosyl hydrolase family 47